MSLYLSLCLIAKDENSYLSEWLDYHILIGVEHFWIYDNESKVPLSETLASYVESGWVTINTIKGQAMQLPAYDHCIQNYGQYSKWIGFIDTDEFIVPHSQNLATFLIPFENYGGLAISSLFFGHGGNKTRPECGQIAGYKIRTPVSFSSNRLVKMIVQPDKVIYPNSPHSFLFRDRFYCVNEKEWRVDAQLYPCHVDDIQINHYFTRSEQEWNDKLSRGRGDSGDPYSDDRWVRVNKFATKEDNSILQLLIKILPDSKKELSRLLKNTEINSKILTDLLHSKTQKIRPGQLIRFDSLQVLPRPEFIEYHESWENSLKFFEDGNFNKAREYLAGQIILFPFDVLRYTNFATACIQQKDFQPAWSALAQAWRFAPKSLYVLLCMTDYFYAIGDYVQAEKTSLMAAALGDLEPIGVAVLALSQWKQGKIQEANVTASSLLLRLSEDELNPIFKELITLMKVNPN